MFFIRKAIFLSKINHSGGETPFPFDLSSVLALSWPRGARDGKKPKVCSANDGGRHRERRRESALRGDGETTVSSVNAALCKCRPARAHLLPVKDDDTPSEAETECWGSPAASNPDVSTGVPVRVRASVCVYTSDHRRGWLLRGWWRVSRDVEL